MSMPYGKCRSKPVNRVGRRLILIPPFLFKLQNHNFWFKRGILKLVPLDLVGYLEKLQLKKFMH